MRRVKSNQRQLFGRVLILCEGDTEKLYFQEIKSSLPRDKKRGLTIDVDKSKGRDPLSLVTEAIRRKASAKGEGNPYKEIWVVFDHDNFPNRELAIKKAKTANLQIAFSSINIEVWFIFHFEYKLKVFLNGDEVKKYFAEKYLKGYQPGRTKVYEQIQSKTNTAIANAERLKEAKKEEIESGVLETNLNPYLTIDALVKFLLDI